MRWTDRDARRRRAKELGRIAYRLVREEAVSGVIDLDGEDKHLKEFDEDGLEVGLLAPFRADALPEEISRLQVRHYGRKVLELRWSKLCDASVVAFEEGDWERILEDQPLPIPFD